MGISDIHKSCYIDKHAVIYGDVEIGEDSSVWPGAVIRCDDSRVKIGKRTSIQDNCIIHADNGHSVTIGDNVTVGHGAIVHGASVGDNCIIGMGSIILDGAVIGDNCFIAAGSVVTPNSAIQKNSMVMGVPGKVIRETSEKEMEWAMKNAQLYAGLKERYKKAYGR